DSLSNAASSECTRSATAFASGSPNCEVFIGSAAAAAWNSAAATITPSTALPRKTEIFSFRREQPRLARCIIKFALRSDDEQRADNASMYAKHAISALGAT